MVFGAATLWMAAAADMGASLPVTCNGPPAHAAPGVGRRRRPQPAGGRPEQPVVKVGTSGISGISGST